jgi:hypothetical protein
LLFNQIPGAEVNQPFENEPTVSYWQLLALGTNEYMMHLAASFLHV